MYRLLCIKLYHNIRTCRFGTFLFKVLRRQLMTHNLQFIIYVLCNNSNNSTHQDDVEKAISQQ